MPDIVCRACSKALHDIDQGAVSAVNQDRQKTRVPFDKIPGAHAAPVEPVRQNEIGMPLFFDGVFGKPHVSIGGDLISLVAEGVAKLQAVCSGVANNEQTGWRWGGLHKRLRVWGRLQPQTPAECTQAPMNSRLNPGECPVLHDEN